MVDFPSIRESMIGDFPTCQMVDLIFRKSTDLEMLQDVGCCVEVKEECAYCRHVQTIFLENDG